MWSTQDLISNLSRLVVVPLSLLLTVVGCARAGTDGETVIKRVPPLLPLKQPVALSIQKPLRSLNAFNTSNSDVEFSPDGRLLAAAGEVAPSSHALKLWSTLTWQLKRTLKHSQSITSFTFSPDGKQLVVGSGRTLNFYGTNSWKLIRTLRSQRNVNDVAFSSNGKYLVAGYNENKAIVWNSATFKALHTFKTTDNVYSVSFSRRGNTLAIGDWSAEVSLWNAGSGKKIRTIRNALSGEAGVNANTSVVFSPDGQMLATYRWNDNVVRLGTWERESQYMLLQRGELLKKDLTGLMALRSLQMGRRL
jgi:WD40 repeat protein